MKDSTCIAILGPTCSGKTEIAVRIAETLQGEIISCDSMQVYRGMDIGTATPTVEERRSIPHHLVDCLRIDAPWSVDRFLIFARKIIGELQSSNTPAVLVGGTGLYAKALIYNFEMPPSDESIAREVSAEYRTEEGRVRLTRELEYALPPGDNHPIPQNPRRFMRAVEVLRITGKPPWAFERARQTPLPGYRQFILMPEPAALKKRIVARVDRMLETGWIEETEQLLSCGLLSTPTARQALGYRDIAEYLRRGRTDHDSLRAQIISRTVKYARRQRTWFRNQHPDATVISLQRPREEDVLQQILQLILADNESTSY